MVLGRSYGDYVGQNAKLVKAPNYKIEDITLFSYAIPRKKPTPLHICTRTYFKRMYFYHILDFVVRHVFISQLISFYQQEKGGNYFTSCSFTPIISCMMYGQKTQTSRIQFKNRIQQRAVPQAQSQRSSCRCGC